MSAHGLMNLLNESRTSDEVRGLLSILSLFRNVFNKFNDTRSQMLDSIYNMNLNYLKVFPVTYSCRQAYTFLECNQWLS